MTVVVGALCQDGVVVGSDSSLTLAATIQSLTIEQPCQKTFVVGDNVLMAGTGEVGLGQRVCAVLEEIRLQMPPEKTQPIAFAKEITKRAIEDFRSTHLQTIGYGALVAFQSNIGFHLCELALGTMQPELITPQVWFSAMGSGKPIADPLLGMMRRVFFDNLQPKLREGVFAVAWALRHAIELNPGGINAPMQIGTLEAAPPTKRMKARLLDAAELEQVEGYVVNAETHLRDYRDILAGKHAETATTTTPPPSPP